MSKSLVSLVMRGAPQVSDARRAAVLAAAEELGYRPNAMAQSLVQRRTHVIGVLLSDVHNPFFADVVGGIAAAARAFGQRALMNTGERAAALEREAIEVLLRLRADGLILASTVVASADLEDIGRQIPTVLASRPSRSAVLDSVATDDLAGSALAVDHLVRLGHRRLAHITGGDGAGSRARARGFARAVKRHGLDARVAEGDYTEAGGIAGVEALMGGRWPPTALLAPNDIAAIGALQALTSRGLRVPEDVSLIGYDDTWVAALEHIALTTVHQDARTIGTAAVDLLQERITGGRTTPRHVVLRPTLTVRETTGAPRPR